MGSQRVRHDWNNSACTHAQNPFSIDGHLGCFHVLATVSCVAMNIGVHVSFQIIFFSGYVPRNGITGSHGSSIFSLLRNLYTVLHSGCTNLHPHQQYTRFPFSPPSHQHLLLLVFLIKGIITGAFGLNSLLGSVGTGNKAQDTNHSVQGHNHERETSLGGRALYHWARLSPQFQISTPCFLLLWVTSCPVCGKMCPLVHPSSRPSLVIFLGPLIFLFQHLLEKLVN